MASLGNIRLGGVSLEYRICIAGPINYTWQVDHIAGSGGNIRVKS